MSVQVPKELSKYETERLETMRQNHEKLVELGLESAVGEIRQVSQAKKNADAAEQKERIRKFPNPKPPAEPSRTSKRLREVKPEYSKEKVDRFGELIDEQIEKRAKKKASSEDKEAARAEAMAAARQLLEEAREKLRRDRGTSSVPAGGDAARWRKEAIRLWGTRAGECETDDWEGYVASRAAAPGPTSPEPLLQEHYADDPWKLLVACALMSRVSSHETKIRCIEGFFELCPNPTAFLEADAGDVEPVIKSLGLFDDRYPTLVNLTSAWLEMPIFNIEEKGTPAGLDPPTSRRSSHPCCPPCLLCSPRGRRVAPRRRRQDQGVRPVHRALVLHLRKGRPHRQARRRRAAGVRALARLGAQARVRVREGAHRERDTPLCPGFIYCVVVFGAEPESGTH